MAGQDDKRLTEITDVLSAPLEDLVASVARGVAIAQHAIDLQSIESFKEIYLSDRNEYREFRRLGYQPTWYRIPEATAQVKVSLSIKQGKKVDVNGRITGENENRLFAASVDAAYSNTYNYKVDASSSLTFRIVPVPPTPQVEDMRAVPELADLTWSEASRLLHALDIPFDTGGTEPTEKAKIASTDPSGGRLLLSGQVLRINFQQP